MKFLHAADIHLDGLSSGLKQFYGDQTLSISELTQRAFVKLIDLAIEEEVDFVIIAGDLFDTNWRDYRLGLFFIEQISRISCPVFYMRGNHDAENRLLKKLTFPDHVHEFTSDSPKTHLIDQLKVAVHGQSYSTYHIREDLSASYPEPVPGYFNIGMLHTSGDVKLGISPYAPYETKNIIQKGYHYWALGHIHNYEHVLEQPLVVYTGCLQGRHFKEGGDKGCCIVEFGEEYEPKVRFVALSELIWHSLTIDISDVKLESELRDRLYHHFDSLDRESGKIYAIRVFFKGICHLEKGLDEDRDYYESQIYLWLNKYDGSIHLEKLVNHTRAPQTLEAVQSKARVLSELLETLDQQIDSEEAFSHFKSLITLLKDKAPMDFQKNPYFRDLEETATLDDYNIKIREYLYRKVVENSE